MSHVAQLNVGSDPEMHVLRQYEMVEAPWKNGGGITRNIAKGLLGDHIAWTISHADVVCNGSFSNFAGLVRVLTVVSGGSMTLKSPDNTFEANLWEPIRFAGELSIDSHLKEGPLTALNLMFNPSYYRGEVELRQGPLDRKVSCPARGVIACHVLSGNPKINAKPLETADTALSDESAIKMSMAQNDVVLEIRLTHLDQSEAIKLSIADR